MENASKALLIASGVLIAIIIISLFLMIYSKILNFKETQAENNRMQQLQDFNAEYEAFDKKIMYGVDVLTLANKVENNNNTYSNSSYQITLYLNNNIVENGKILLNSDENIKTKMFTCDLIKYNELGRVSQIYVSNY